jgi:hypothetical protein
MYLFYKEKEKDNVIYQTENIYIYIYIYFHVMLFS